ncbi:MAG: DNA repair ATPase, partial [Bradymonadaceae bacterium]
MSSTTEEEKTGDDGQPAVQSSNYDIIRRRLVNQGEDLRERAESLNTRRQDFFGSTQMTVIGQDRIRTENNCIPVDIVAVGGKLLFGYNVFIGLRKTTSVDDVFSLHKFTRSEDEGIVLDHVSQDNSRNFLSDPRFLQDFDDLYTYYKDAHLLQLRRVEGKLLAIFQIGSSLTDVRVLRWGISATGEVTYIDNSGIRDNVLVPPHDFPWTSVGREDHVSGRHPHISIRDKVFVETVGGDLTVKIEDNTEDGQGIYREPVEDQNQALGDAGIHFAELGNLILIRIRPYREEVSRYFVFNTVTQTIARIDAIGQSCVQLPEDHGVIFPGGYVLADGEHRAFDADIAGMRFTEVIRSPNGEDVIYAFYRPKDGRYILLAYNLIRKEVQNPIHCHGYSLFDDGSLIVFRVAGTDPTRVHPMQIWQSPFVSDEYAAAQPTDGSFLSKIGNAELVRGISEALTIVRMVNNQQPTVAIYETLISAVQRTRDSYFWLADEEAENLGHSLEEIARTAELIIDEFVKVTQLKAQAARAITEIEEAQHAILRDIRYDDWQALQRFIDGLGSLRGQRGRLISMREIRYIDQARLSELEEEVVENFDNLSRATVDFLLGEDALSPYRKSLEDLVAEVDTVKDTVQARELREKLDEIGEGLTL